METIVLVMASLKLTYLLLFEAMPCLIDYYSEAVRLDVDALPLTLRVRYALLTQRMLEHGPDLGAPHIVLHSFVKKTDKIPAKDLALARNRLKELKNDR